MSYLRVLTSTPDDRLAELWDKVDRKEHPVLANERLCAILRGIDQVIDLYIYLKRDAGIYLEIEDGDLIDNKL
ncbi:MAG: hypothetical protein LBJ37_00860 [Paucimonas sp.]|nr:hypothetical protein [Paucimonas sp.]